MFAEGPGVSRQAANAGPTVRRVRRYGFGLLLLCCLRASAGLGQSPQVQEAFQRGALAMRNGRSADAEVAFRSAVGLAPDLAEAHLDLGLVLGREGKTEEARSSLKRAIELDPKLPSANMFLGIFLYQANQGGEAVRYLNQELVLDPKNVEALTWLGIVETAGGHPERAVGPLDRAAELTPDDLTLLEYRGKAHSLVAQQSYARMAQLNPSSWQVHKVQAELFAGEDKAAESIKEYQAAIQNEQGNADLYEGLGDEYRQMNELESAQKAYTKELELNPQNPLAMYNLGSTDIDRGDYAAGVPLLEGTLERYRGIPVIEYYLGRGLAGEGKEAEAIARLERSAKADPESELAKRSYYELARLYRRAQRPADADRALAEEHRLREAQTKKNMERAEDWRKLGPPAPGAAGPTE